MSKTLLRKIIIIAVVVVGVAIFALSVYFAVDYDKKQGITVTVVSDIHVVTDENMSQEWYESLENTEKLRHVSDALFRSFCDAVVKDGTKYLLITGDLTEFGDEASHVAVADMLKSLEQRGIKVFVINGNHDVRSSPSSSKISQENFKSVYSDFGYAEALSTYEGTLSYTADIDDGVRLIAIDNIGYYRDDGTYKDSMDDGHRFWIYAQIDECIRKGYRPVVMTHKPLMNHFPALYDCFTGDDDEKRQNNLLLSYFAEKEVEMVFVGHMHICDTLEKTYEINDEKYSIIEVMNPCLSMYGNSYKNVRFGQKEIEVTTSVLSTVNAEYLTEFTSEEEKAQLSADLQQHSMNYLRNYFSNIIYSLADDGGLLDITFTGDAEKYNVLMQIIKDDVVKMCINSPYHIADEVEIDGVTVPSMERILQTYGLEMPTTDCKNIMDLVMDALCEVLEGDQDLTDESLSELVKYTFYEIFYFIDLASDKINEQLATLGYDSEINLDMERLFVNGELECCESGFIAPIIDVAKNVLGGIIPSSYSWLLNMLDGFKSDLSMLSMELIANLVAGFTDDIVVGYGEYIGVDYIDLEGLIVDGIFGTYVADYTTDATPSDISFVIKK